MRTRVGQRGGRVMARMVPVVAGALLLGACGSSGGTELAVGQDGGVDTPTTTVAGAVAGAGAHSDDTTGGGLGGLINGVEVTTSTVAPESTVTTAAPVIAAPPTTAPRPVITQPPVTLPPVTAPPVTAPPPTVAPVNPSPVTANDLSAIERRMVDTVNAGRGAQGLGGLVPAADLTGSARNDATAMSAQGRVVQAGVYNGLSRSWTQVVGQTFQGTSVDYVVGQAGGPAIQGAIPANATHIGVGVGTDAGGQAFVSMRYAVL